ncbi:hypothetical protein BKA56DRAFT_615625 [Ilyonectria sp. MPI-CAGE-AT-0026]|nr:hypothetical protein BKA56DRAFT_615625 [Ilyonectria sp. MPI-CAGE-AT-0026]
MDTTPAASPARVEDDPIWTHDSHTDPLADPEPNQQSPYQTNRTSAGDSTACTDASFNVSPTSPESQLYLSVPDEQQLATGATSKPAIIMTDAHSDQVCMSTSRDDAIPRAHTSSPAVRLLPESQQEQGFNHTSCGSSDTKSESSEAESRSPFGARVSQELPSRRRSRRRSPYAYETVEDDLDVPECVRDEDYCPSPPKVQGSGSEDDDFDDEEHQDRKRRKVSRPPSCSIRNTSTSAPDSRRRRRSTRAIAHSLRERDTSALSVLSPTPSHARSVPSEASAFLARFQE